MIQSCATLLALALLPVLTTSVQAQMSDDLPFSVQDLPPGFPIPQSPRQTPPTPPNSGLPTQPSMPRQPGTPPQAGGIDINALTPEQLDELRRRLALPSTLAPVAPTAPPEPLNLPTDIYQMIKDSLIIVKGESGTGSGFLLDIDGETFAMTNAHVLDGNRTFSIRRLNNEELGLSGLALADNADIAQIKLRDKVNGLPFLKDIDNHVHIGDQVVVIGNSLGADVVTQIVGRVTGIGPNLVETDAKFVSGNSGSPIIHVPTRQVIGIATFSMMQRSSSFGSDSQFQGVERRFGYRIDKVGRWDPMNWNQFLTQSEIVKRTKAYVFGSAMISRLPLTENRLSIRNMVSPSVPFSGVVKSYTDKVHPKLSSVQARSETKKFFMTLANLMERDLHKPEQLDQFGGYFRMEMRRLLEFGDKVQEALKKRSMDL